MNTMILLFKKDALRLRTLLLWWLFPVAWTVLQFCWNQSLNFSDNAMPVHFSGSILGLSALLLLMIVPILIQEDSLVDPSAFWRARPVSKEELFAEKTAFLGLLISLLTLAKGLELAALGLAYEKVLSQALFFGLKIAALVSYLALVSAVTPNFRKFVLYAILGPVVCALLAGFSGSIVLMLLSLLTVLLRLGAAIPTGFNAIDPSAGIQVLNGNEAQDLITLPVVFLAGTALLCHQYLTRRTRTTKILALAVLPTMVAVQAVYVFVLSVLQAGRTF